METAEIHNVQEFVHKIAYKFSRCSHKTIDYTDIAEDFRILSGARFVALNEVSDYGEYTTTRAIAGIQGRIQKASKIFGFTLTDAAYTVDPHIKEVFKAEGVVEFDDLCALAGNQIPKALCKRTAQLFGLGRAFALAMFDHHGPIADLIFIFGKDDEMRNRLEVETLSAVLSLCLQRVYAEQDTVLKLMNVCGVGGAADTAAYETLFHAADKMPDLIYHLDTEGNIEFINQAVQRYGYKREELTGTHILELVHPLDREKAKWKLNERRADERRTRKFEVRLKTGDQHTVFFSLYNRRVPKDPILLIDAEGLYTGPPGKSDFLGTFGVGHDVTEQKLLRDELDQHTHMFRTIIEHMGEAAWLEEINPQQTLYLNPACEKLFQITAEGLQTDPRLWLQVVHPEDRPRVQAAMNQLIEEQTMEPIEYRVFGEDGAERWVRTQVFPVTDPYGNVGRFVGIAHDITRAQQEKQLMQQKVATEKAYVREINHRVKNNLMMLDSMLNLELGNIKDLPTGGNESEKHYSSEVLSKVKARIRAVGLVHEMLYSSSQDKAVEACSYLQELGGSILEADDIGREKISLNYYLTDSLWMPVRVVIPLGMIFSELITNALKYAFPGDRKGEIWVRLYAEEHQQYCLEVCDDGVELPADFKEKRMSIGHSLINSLAMQLNGEFEIDAGQGRKCFKISFRLT